MLAVVSSAAFAQQTDTRTRVFDSNFKSLRAYVAGNYYAPPVIELGGTDQVVISFDELSAEMQYLRYSLVHCDADWQPSQLVESEYVDGFNEAQVDTYDYSQATLANYVNYKITVPNADMQFKLSGNYLLKVYPEYNPDRVCLQVRFSVVENLVKVESEVTSRTDLDYNDKHQQLSVAVDVLDYPVENIYGDLKVRIVQNSRHDNVAAVSRPLRVSGKTAFFEHDRNLIFPAANEFRRFEMVTTNYNGMGIEQYSFHEPYYHATLKTDRPRSFLDYIYDRTQYGRFTVRGSDVYDSETGADYMVVHFALQSPPLSGGKLYVDGEFTQHNFTGSNQMHYNSQTGCYEASLMLKQGAYNYQYLWVPDGSQVGKADEMEGNYYQTVNEYQILVYNRKRGERYDRLIGYNIIYSGI